MNKAGQLFAAALAVIVGMPAVGQDRSPGEVCPAAWV